MLSVAQGIVRLCTVLYRRLYLYNSFFSMRKCTVTYPKQGIVTEIVGNVEAFKFRKRFTGVLWLDGLLLSCHKSYEWAL